MCFFFFKQKLLTWLIYLIDMACYEFLACYKRNLRKERKILNSKHIKYTTRYFSLGFIFFNFNYFVYHVS